MFKRISVRTNEALKSYLVWLRTNVYALLSSSEQAKAKSMNVSLVEKLYLERTNQAEQVFLTNDKTFPVIKIIGNAENLSKLTQDGIEYAAFSLKEFAGIFDENVEALADSLPFETDLTKPTINGQAAGYSGEIPSCFP